MKILFSLCSLLVTILTAGAQGSVEAMLGYSYPASNYLSSIGSSAGPTVGWTFEPTTDIDVTALGAFGYAVQGSGNMEVGLWNASGTLLASNTVAVTGSSGDTVYSSITPLLLLAGQTYYLGARSPNTIYFYLVGPGTDGGGSAMMSPEIQLGMVASNANGFFAFPGTIEGQSGDAVVAPNFLYQAVPEPSMAGLLESGVAVALVTIRQRRIKSPATDA